MTTIDPKLLALMHEEIDGSITEDGRAELQAGLSREEKNREFFERLQRMSQILANIEDVCEPEDLHQEIMRSVRAVAPPGARGLGSWLDSWRTDPRGALRYGYALAAGILLGVVGMLGIQWTAPFAPSLVSGTMGHRDGTSGPHLIQEVLVDLPEVTGHIDLMRSGGSLVVESGLASSAATGAMQVIVSFDPSLAGFQGVSQSDGALLDLQVGSGQVAWKFSGHLEATLRLDSFGEGPREIEVEFFFRGTRIHEITLRPDGSV